MEAIERIRGFACEVDQSQWKELVRVADEVEIPVWTDSRSEGVTNESVFAQLDDKDGDLCLFNFKGKLTLIPYSEFLAKLKGEPQPTTPFAEQVAANIIKISCNNKTPYADKMKMVVEAILEFERDPKNKKA